MLTQFRLLPAVILEAVNPILQAAIHMSANRVRQPTKNAKLRLRQFVSTILLLSLSCPALIAVELSEIDLTVVDADTNEPIAARLRISNSRGRPPRIRDVPRLGNDVSFRDTLTFKLKPGHYQFTIDHGPHYQQRTGRLEVNRDGFDQKTVTLPRFVDIRKEGYFSGDLLLTRDQDDIELLMNAEELDVAARPSWNAGVAFSLVAAKLDRTIYSQESVRDFSATVLESDGGRLFLGNVPSPIDPTAFATTPLDFATKAGEIPHTHLALLDPWGWDTPMLVAHGNVDSIAIMGDALQLAGDKNNVQGRKLKNSRFQDQHGAGLFAEHIFFELLNCGIKIAPSAFSNSGDTKNPPGFNRVYVSCGQDFSADTWWRNLAAGESIVSNGPVLRALANGQKPGHVFKSDEKELVVELTAELATRQKVEYLEIIKNGRVVQEVRLDEWVKAGGHLPLITFTESGWFLVRAYAPSEQNYRCAMTAPFFVELNEQTRVSKKSAQFFADWVMDRAKQLRKAELPKDELRERIKEQKFAHDFWTRLVTDANAD